jgi:hypothetical protein
LASPTAERAGATEWRNGRKNANKKAKKKDAPFHFWFTDTTLLFGRRVLLVLRTEARWKGSILFLLFERFLF